MVRVDEIRLAGLEPATIGLEGRCSIRLSYRREMRASHPLEPLLFCRVMEKASEEDSLETPRTTRSFIASLADRNSCHSSPNPTLISVSPS